MHIPIVMESASLRFFRCSTPDALRLGGAP